MTTQARPAAGPVTVLAAAVLRETRVQARESRETLAMRAGMSPALIAAIEDGDQPAWDLPFAELHAVERALHPSDAVRFWIAGWCDWLLTAILDTDWVLAEAAATEVFGDPDQAPVAMTLLRRAIRPAGTAVPLLDIEVRARVRQAATTLASSQTSQGWIGTRILSVFPAASRHPVPAGGAR